MKTIITFFLSSYFFVANAQVTEIMNFKPALEAYDGLKTKGINFALLPNKSFFMIELGTEWENYGTANTENSIQNEANIKSPVSATSMAYTLTLGTSIFNGTNSPQIDVIPFGFLSMNKYVGALGGGLKILRSIRSLNLYAGGYIKYTYSEYTKFLDAGLSINYYFTD